MHYIFRLQVYLKTMNAMRAKCIKYEFTGEMYVQRNNEYIQQIQCKTSEYSAPFRARYSWLFKK